jgi:hypothetical protein
VIFSTGIEADGGMRITPGSVRMNTLPSSYGGRFAHPPPWIVSIQSAKAA